MTVFLGSHAKNDLTYYVNYFSYSEILEPDISQL